jgi:predicted O-linked N-acetylglucosamine transferase (SPINDLY family)
MEQVDDTNFKEQSQKLRDLYNLAQKKFIETKEVDNDKYVECIKLSNELIKYFGKMHLFQINRNKDDIKTTYYINSELLVRTVGLGVVKATLTDVQKNTLYTAVNNVRKVLSIEPLNKMAMELYKMVLIYLTLHNADAEENVKILSQVLMVDPCDYQLHYNLGFVYHRINNLEKSLEHYKMSLGIIDLMLPNLQEEQKQGLLDFKVKVLNGLGSIYFSIQDRDLAQYFYEMALEISPNDPDLNNQMGVVNTELRYTDKAIYYYKKGIENYKNAHISIDKDMLIASMYMNMGLAYCYECNFEEAINSYNKALQYKPRLSLAYQNKLLDLNYISHLIDDPMYVSKLHKNINKIYETVISDYKVGCPNYKVKKEIVSAKTLEQLKKSGTKIRVGFVSGDFICHPVSYFLSSVLKNFDDELFEIYLYSVKVIKLDNLYTKCKCRVVKNTSPQNFKKMIQEDNIDMLFDMSGHTGDNRLDTFVLKPAPIQISYCGYPNTSGIRSIDYRLTDKFCDSDKSQKYFQEKLVFLQNCFLSYTPSIGFDKMPELKDQPATKNGYITFGTFNRYNKINKNVIGAWKRILEEIPNARFVIKTKEFLTDKIRQDFLDSIGDKSILKRVKIIEYSDTYTEHLPDYNEMDISLDTFPYSGTTTSCESLAMGVPVITLFDNVRHYHSQNVTTSLMINSNLNEYVTYSIDEYIEKAKYFANNLDKLKDLKKVVRKKFYDGHVCQHQEFVNDFQETLFQLYKTHKW